MQQFGSWLTGTLSLDVLRLKPEQGVHKVESELEGSKKQAWGFEFNAQFASLRPHRVSVASADGEDGGQMHLVMLDDSLLIFWNGSFEVYDPWNEHRYTYGDEEYDSEAPWYMNNEGEEHYDPDGQVRELIGMMKEHFREQRDRVS
ncbi:hypothetical protein HBH69_111000 [Parastagonospora nodorum]|nr:hypothetical protein HBH69_111000 [Parastagonospora nodorum]